MMISCFRVMRFLDQAQYQVVAFAKQTNMQV